MNRKPNVQPLSKESQGGQRRTFGEAYLRVKRLLKDSQVKGELGSDFQDLIDGIASFTDTEFQSGKRQGLFLTSTHPADTLGRAHTDNLSETSKKVGGVVYTPPELARLIVNLGLDALGYQPRTILDPACGSGIFLTEAFKAITERFAEADDNSQQTLKGLYGVDIDGVALKSAKAALLLEYFALNVADEAHVSSIEIDQQALDKVQAILSILGSNLISDNFLLPSQAESPLLNQGLRSADSADLPNHPSYNEFADLIIGNPPYGLSRDEKILPIEKRQLEIGYKDWLSGKIDKYQLFMAQSFRLLRPGGVCAMIVPTSWLGISSAKILRKRLLNSLCELVSINYPAFNNQGVETAIVVFKKSEAVSKNPIKLSIVSNKEYLNNLIGEDSRVKLPRKLLPRTVVAAQPENLISRLWETGLEEIFAKLNQQQLRMGDPESPFTPLIALQAYAVGKGTPPQTKEMVKSHCYHVSSSQEFDGNLAKMKSALALTDQQTLIPYLDGADVTRSGISWSGQYLIYGPNLAEFYPIERYTKPRILLREILAPSPQLIMACFTDKHFAYNRSILHIHAKDSARSHLLPGLTVFLNSKLAALQLAIWGRKSQRKLFPKLLADDLRNFPLPSEEILTTLSEAHSLLYSQEFSSNLDTELNKIVLSAFGLTKEHLDLIDNTLKSPLLRQMA